MTAPTSSIPDRGIRLIDQDVRGSSLEVGADSKLLVVWMRKCQAINALWQGKTHDLKNADMDTVVYKEVAQKIALAAQFPRFVPRSGLSSFEAGLDLLVATLRNDHTAIRMLVGQYDDLRNENLVLAHVALFVAVEKGFPDAVASILSGGIDVDSRDSEGLTCLHVASERNDRKMVEFLLSKEANVNCISDTFMTPLDLVNGKRGSEDMDQMRSYIVENGGMTTLRIRHSQGDAEVTPLYQPLNKDKREIRLLLIEKSGVSPDMPSCFLQTFPIGAAPPYYALSYTWGDPNITGHVLINNKKVTHTVNAIAAITALRQMLPLETVPDVHHIWIDAICIDQNNMAEKSSQISLMREIYSQAKRVLVWLGEESDNSSAAMDLLVQLGYLHKLKPLCEAAAAIVANGRNSFSALREDKLVLRLGIGEENEPGIPGVEVSFNLQPGDGVGVAFTNQLGSKEFVSPADVVNKSWLHESVKRRWDALERLLCRPYWSRVWILQEIGLASSIPPPLLICGKRALTWTTFNKAIGQLSQLMSEGNLNTEQNRELSELNLGSWIRVHVLNSLEPIRWIMDRPEKVQPDYDMIDLVCFTSHSIATNPRDKIYALLGLVSPERRSSIVPDYGLPVERVYTDFVVAEIQRSKKLDVLCLEHQLSVDKKILPLPSWVLDLTSQTRQGFPPTLMRSHPHIKERARASDGEPHVWRVSGNAEELIVRGIQCCTVRSVTPPESRPSVRRGGHEIMKAWLEFARRNLPQELPGGLPLSQLFFRTLIRDMSGQGPPGHEMDREESRRLRRLAYGWISSHMLHQVKPDEYPRSRLVEEFQHILRHKHDDTSEDGHNGDECWGFDKGKLREQLPSEVLSLMGTVVPVQFQFALFTTAKGYLGLGPKYVREGDILVVLAGMCVPAILRPMQDHYIFLGDCYVYDLMQGQAVRSARQEERGFDEFILR